MKTVCIYHSVDLDGWMSAAIVKHWFLKNRDGIDEKYPIVSMQENNSVSKAINGQGYTLDFIGYNYGQPIPDLSEYDKVIMCDISFPADKMFELQNIFHISGGASNFIWCDHHISAINSVKDFFEVAPGTSEDNKGYPEGFRNVKFAACELTWKYFFPDDSMPEIVRLLGRYDCFGHKGTEEEKKVLEFQYGARQCISNYEEAYSYLIQCTRTKESEYWFLQAQVVVGSILEQGKAIYQYLCTEAKQTYKTGFEIELKEIGVKPQHASVLRRFICINKERFNPINFGIDYHAPIEEIYWCIENPDDYGLLCKNGNFTKDSDNSDILKFKTKIEAITFLDKHEAESRFMVTEHMWTSRGYDGCACFWFANGVWNFSLYNDNGAVDCSVIAGQYGGGGHKGAAGFKSTSINEWIK